MRKAKEMQMKLGEVNIADIEFDLRSRDEIPQLLHFGQYQLIFELLKSLL